MIITLYNGKQIESWLSTDDEEVIQLVIHFNSVCLTIPKGLVSELAFELNKVAEAIKAREQRN